MSTLELRRRIKRRVDALPERSLEVAADFLAWLGQREASEKQTPDRSPLHDRLKAAERAIAVGRVTPITRLKRKY
jgi:hypothetical protein